MLERTKAIHIRATPEELEKIMKRMEESGITSLTAYLLRMALYGYVIVMDLSDLKEILRLLQISGNNLNQYAKKANVTGNEKSAGPINSNYVRQVREWRQQN